MLTKAAAKQMCDSADCSVVLLLLITTTAFHFFWCISHGYQSQAASISHVNIYTTLLNSIHISNPQRWGSTEDCLKLFLPVLLSSVLPGWSLPYPLEREPTVSCRTPGICSCQKAHVCMAMHTHCHRPVDKWIVVIIQAQQNADCHPLQMFCWICVGRGIKPQRMEKSIW